MTDSTADDDARRGAIDFARRLVPRLQAVLGSDLLGGYLIGSLAHGGFNRRYSDIDAAVVTAAGLSPQAIDAVRGEAAALSADWGGKLSLFWSDRHFTIGRFPPLDRIDYLDRPLVLMERERVKPPRPTRDEIRHYLRGAPFTNWRENAKRFAAAEALEPKDRKAYLRVLLYPARFCYSYMTGQMASNDAAAAFLREQHLSRLDLTSIECALQIRHAAADPDPLFPARTLLPAQVDACAALFAGESGMA